MNMSVKIGELEIDDLTLKMVTKLHLSFSYLLTNNLVLDAIAEKLEVKRNSVLKAINLILNLSIDTFSFLAIEALIGNIQKDEFMKITSTAMKFAKKEERGVTKISYALTLASFMAQLAGYERIVIIGGRCVEGEKYFSMREDWTKELMKLLILSRDILKKMESGKKFSLDDIANIIKNYVR